MTIRKEGEITRVLRVFDANTRDAVNRVVPLAYDELHRLAERCLAREPDGSGLGATDLVHEAYLRLLRQRKVGFHNRQEFFAAAATVMRRVLVDHARAMRRKKRGGGTREVALDGLSAVAPRREPSVIELDDALTELAEVDPRKARLVELRFFAGVSMAEAAEILQVTRRTVERDWRFARVWLRQWLEHARTRSRVLRDD